MCVCSKVMIPTCSISIEVHWDISLVLIFGMETYEYWSWKFTIFQRVSQLTVSQLTDQLEVRKWSLTSHQGELQSKNWQKFHEKCETWEKITHIPWQNSESWPLHSLKHAPVVFNALCVKMDLHVIASQPARPTGSQLVFYWAHWAQLGLGCAWAWRWAASGTHMGCPYLTRSHVNKSQELVVSHFWTSSQQHWVLWFFKLWGSEAENICTFWLHLLVRNTRWTDFAWMHWGRPRYKQIQNQFNLSLISEEFWE